MPYKVFRTGPRSNPHCVYKLDAEGKRTGKSLGCHPSNAAALNQTRAIYAAEGRAKEAAGRKSALILEVIHDNRDTADEVKSVYENLGLTQPSWMFQ